MTATAAAPMAFYKHRSALEAFACPFYFKRRYIDQVPDTSNEARRGTAFHLVMQHYVRLLVEHGCEDDLDLAQQAFELGIVESMVPEFIIAEVEDLFWRFVEIFKLKVDAVYLHEAQAKEDTEYRWRADLIYALPSALEIPDWKTHWQILSPSAAKAEFQPQFYAARARRVFPNFPVYRFVFWFVRWNVPVPVEYTHAELDAFEARLPLLEAGIERAIATNDFPAVPGDTCRFCRLNDCPVANDARVLSIRVMGENLEDQTQHAQQLLGEYLTLQNAANARRKALEGYAAIDGPVTLNGVEFGPRPTSRAEFPIDQVLPVLQAHDIAPAFTVSQTALKPYLTQKRYGHVRAELEAVRVTKAGSEFRVRKVGDVAPSHEGDDRV